MSGAPTPQGYDVSKAVPIAHPECLVTVGFDRQETHIPRFMVALQYLQSPVPLTWEMIARFDHNETSTDGHDLYDEGIHIDVKTPTDEVTLHPPHQPLPADRGRLIRACVEYLEDHAQYFVDVSSGDVSPSNPPAWPDGGDPSLSPYVYTPE